MCAGSRRAFHPNPTPNPTPYTLYSASYALHPTPHVPIPCTSAVLILHSHTPNPTPRTLHLAPCTAVIEFREEAPAGASRDMYAADAPPATARRKSSLLGGLAVAVPTELHGLYVAWERHGKLPWARLVTPAADLADGFAVGKLLAQEIAEHARFLARFPTTAAVFLKSDGQSPLLQVRGGWKPCGIS